MNDAWRNAVNISAGVVFVAGIVFCVLIFTQHRRISYWVSLYMIGALLTVTVACYLMNVWLGLSYTPYYDGLDFISWHNGVFSEIPFRLMIYVFSAMLGHFLIFSSAHLISQIRRRTATIATIGYFASAMLAMVGTVAVIWNLWSGPYADTRSSYERYGAESQDVTEQYLTEWLDSEPNSPYALKLYEAFKEQ